MSQLGGPPQCGSEHRRGPIKGVRVLEFAGLGPVPYACMLLADMGAEVVHIARVDAPPPDPRSPLMRGRQEIVQLDLKKSADIEKVMALVRAGDILVEGFRPGVMERLGLGPEPILCANPRLVYGRMTGWGQFGPRAQDAGHDINFLAQTGALAAIGSYGGKPIPPLNLLGDFGGGSLFLVMGILAAVIEARASGLGQVVDAAICDGVTSLMGMIANFAQATGPSRWTEERGDNLLDGGRHFYNTYRCADGKYVAVGAIEPRFYSNLCALAGLDESVFAHRDVGGKEARILIDRLAAIFATRDRDEWCSLAEGKDACISAVLTMAEASNDAHNQARELYININGVKQPAVTPKFSRTPGNAVRTAILAGDVDTIVRRWREQSAACGPGPVQTS